MALFRLLPLLLLISSCSGDSSTSPEAAEQTAPESKPSSSVLVRVEPLAQRLSQRTIEVVADIVSLDEVDLFPERTQPVVELLVEEGDRVQTGQILARLRDEVETLAVAEAQVRLKEAENEAARAERDHHRNVSLAAQEVGTRLLSDRELETSEQAMFTAITGASSAKVALDRAQLELEQTVLRAPIQGTVAIREISLGDMGNPATRAFQIVDDSQPKALFSRPQKEWADLKVGQRLTGQAEALPGRILFGKIERISPTIDSASGTLRITANIDTSEGPVPIGVFGRFELILDEHEDALMIPKKAVLMQGKQMFCFVARDDAAVRVDFEPGFEETDFIEALVEENGLLPGDLLIVVGADRLRDGDLIEIADA